MNTEFLMLIMLSVFYLLIQDQASILDLLKQYGDKYRSVWNWIRQAVGQVVSDEDQINEAWTTHTLIFINVAAFVAALALGYDDIIMDFSFIPLYAGEFWRWITHQFIHAAGPAEFDIFSAHLLFNMLYLYVFGDNVEAVFQRIMQKKGTTLNLYAVFYLTAGAFAAATEASFRGWDTIIAMVGASGAISGVLGFYLVFFPRNSVWLREIGNVPAVVFILLWIFSNIVMLFTDSSVAVMAHLGGLFYGAVVALILKRVAGNDI